MAETIAESRARASAQGGDVTGVREYEVQVAGCSCRVWEKGSGAPLVFLAGLRGAPRWRRFFDRLAEHSKVIVPSLPGFPGAGDGHREFDSIADWVAATLDLIEAAGGSGGDLVAESIGGMLAADVAALSPASVRRLVLMGSWGLYDPADPIASPFEQPASETPDRLVADPAAYDRDLGCDAPESDRAAATDWEVMHYRADEAAARLVWPFGERGLAKRMHRISAPTLVVWGGGDRIIPASYAERFVRGIRGAQSVILEGAGHLVSVDAPEEAARKIMAFLGHSKHGE